MNSISESATEIKSNLDSQWKVQLAILCGMMLLALVGMGLSQSTEQGVWEYWLFVVLVYASLGLWRSTRKAKQAGKPIKKLMFRELAHWSVLLAFLGVLVFLERRELINRQSASDFSLLMLALSCCLAGVHFDWPMLIVGVFLAVMAVATATLEQYTLWITMVVAVFAAAAFFYAKTRFSSTKKEEPGNG